MEKLKLLKDFETYKNMEILRLFEINHSKFKGNKEKLKQDDKDLVDNIVFYFGK